MLLDQKNLAAITALTGRIYLSVQKINMFVDIGV